MLYAPPATSLVRQCLRRTHQFNLALEALHVTPRGSIIVVTTEVHGPQRKRQAWMRYASRGR
jgi:hypothetical protein